MSQHVVVERQGEAILNVYGPFPTGGEAETWAQQQEDVQANDDGNLDYDTMALSRPMAQPA